MTTDTERRTYKPVEVMQILRISRPHLYELLNSGEIPGAKRFGQRWFIPREPFDRWLSGQ